MGDVVRVSDNGFCCGCCVGAALVYLLVPGAHCEEVSRAPSTGKAASGIEQVVTASGIDGSLAAGGLSAGQDNAGRDKQGFLLRQISHYQADISPKLHELVGAEKICKYEPSCSEYAKQAIEKHGNVKGSLLAASRLARCNPLSQGGYDPV